MWVRRRGLGGGWPHPKHISEQKIYPHPLPCDAALPRAVDKDKFLVPKVTEIYPYPPLEHRKGRAVDTFFTRDHNNRALRVVDGFEPSAEKADVRRKRSSEQVWRNAVMGQRVSLLGSCTLTLAFYFHNDRPKGNRKTTGGHRLGCRTNTTSDRLAIHFASLFDCGLVPCIV